MNQPYNSSILVIHTENDHVNIKYSTAIDKNANPTTIISTSP